ncbi:hypothetical protein AB0395_00815 [Streptosporangium sp. NPDC051023]|uniref:hypothetical protein n=1 Tax=Streptosporangium sp. NPDC051023 TaxID=3155410 RepID=UPI00344D0D89
MTSLEAEEFQKQASKLRKFANDVEKLADGAHDMAGGMEWSGPLTDRVRGEIATWRTRCATVAANLRQEADRLDAEARGLMGRNH